MKMNCEVIVLYKWRCAVQFFLSAFLQNFFLCQERLSGDVPPHLAQPCYVTLGRALIWCLYPNWFEGFVNWVIGHHGRSCCSVTGFNFAELCLFMNDPKIGQFLQQTKFSFTFWLSKFFPLKKVLLNWRLFFSGKCDKKCKKAFPLVWP